MTDQERIELKQKVIRTANDTRAAERRGDVAAAGRLWHEHIAALELQMGRRKHGSDPLTPVPPPPPAQP